MRLTIAAVAALVFLCPTFAHAQSWTSTRVGQYDWTCETVPGVFVSGHQRQDLAFASCTAAKLANPGSDYQVRGGTYRVAVVAQTSAQTPTATPAALAIDPKCPALSTVLDIRLGTAFTTPAYETCLAGAEKSIALWSLERIDGDPPTSISVDAHGVVSRAAGGAAGAGHLGIIVTPASGIALRIPYAWRVAP